MATHHIPSTSQYVDLDPIEDLLLSFEDEPIVTNDFSLARLPRIHLSRPEPGPLAFPTKSPERSTELPLQSDPSDPAFQNTGSLPDSPHALPLCGHHGDDEAHVELSTDARLTFDRSVLKLRYGDDKVGTLGTEFSPSRSALHAADLYVFWYALFEVLVLEPLLQYAWIFGLAFGVWSGCWLSFCLVGRPIN